MSTADVSLSMYVDAAEFCEQLAAALIAVEPTPIWDQLVAERRAGGPA